MMGRFGFCLAQVSPPRNGRRGVRRGWPSSSAGSRCEGAAFLRVVFGLRMTASVVSCVVPGVNPSAGSLCGPKDDQCGLDGGVAQVFVPFLDRSAVGEIARWGEARHEGGEVVVVVVDEVVCAVRGGGENEGQGGESHLVRGGRQDEICFTVGPFDDADEPGNDSGGTVFLSIVREFGDAARGRPEARGKVEGTSPADLGIGLLSDGLHGVSGVAQGSGGGSGDGLGGGAGVGEDEAGGAGHDLGGGMQADPEDGAAAGSEAGDVLGSGGGLVVLVVAVGDDDEQAGGVAAVRSSPASRASMARVNAS